MTYYAYVNAHLTDNSNMALIRTLWVHSSYHIAWGSRLAVICLIAVHEVPYYYKIPRWTSVLCLLWKPLRYSALWIGCTPLSRVCTRATCCRKHVACCRQQNCCQFVAGLLLDTKGYNVAEIRQHVAANKLRVARLPATCCSSAQHVAGQHVALV